MDPSTSTSATSQPSSPIQFSDLEFLANQQDFREAFSAFLTKFKSAFSVTKIEGEKMEKGERIGDAVIPIHQHAKLSQSDPRHKSQDKTEKHMNQMSSSPTATPSSVAAAVGCKEPQDTTNTGFVSLSAAKDTVLSASPQLDNRKSGSSDAEDKPTTTSKKGPQVNPISTLAESGKAENNNGHLVRSGLVPALSVEMPADINVSQRCSLNGGESLEKNPQLKDQKATNRITISSTSWAVSDKAQPHSINIGPNPSPLLHPQSNMSQPSGPDTTNPKAHSTNRDSNSQTAPSQPTGCVVAGSGGGEVSAVYRWIVVVGHVAGLFFFCGRDTGVGWLVCMYRLDDVELAGGKILLLADFRNGNGLRGVIALPYGHELPTELHHARRRPKNDPSKPGQCPKCTQEADLDTSFTDRMKDRPTSEPPRKPTPNLSPSHNPAGDPRTAQDAEASTGELSPFQHQESEKTTEGSTNAGQNTAYRDETSDARNPALSTVLLSLSLRFVLPRILAEKFKLLGVLTFENVQFYATV
ncbi:chloride channel E [Striga asiatica]|uniref:Chloride channel E n=1 Tax=Striga asiatica TaxID=4170 RepID=A0A5A7QVX7_STRAF|nr:chloride channel E [Striga asiatica]